MPGLRYTFSYLLHLLCAGEPRAQLPHTADRRNAPPKMHECSCGVPLRTTLGGKVVCGVACSAGYKDFAEKEELGVARGVVSLQPALSCGVREAEVSKSGSNNTDHAAQVKDIGPHALLAHQQVLAMFFPDSCTAVSSRYVRADVGA